MENKLDDLLISATESDNPELLSEIVSILSANGGSTPEEVMDGLSMIIESWQLDPIGSPNKTHFLIEITRFFDENFPQLRSVLPMAVKKILPPEINKTMAVKALKIRDDSTPLANVYCRYKNLIALKADSYFYNTDSTNWGMIGRPDWITGTLPLLKLNGAAFREAEISIVLDRICIFDSKANINTLLKESKLPTSNELLDKLVSNACSLVKMETIQKALFTLLVPEKLKPSAFEKWIKSSEAGDAPSASEGTLLLEKVRSVKELSNFVKQDTSFTIPKENLPKIAGIFNSIRLTSSAKDFLLWAETMCSISKSLGSDEILSIVPQNETIRDRLWPACSELEGSIGLEIWCQLKAGMLPTWTKITELANDTEYLLELCLHLPWRDWNAITTILGTEKLETILSGEARLSNSEALLWIWKNRKKVLDTTAKKLNTLNFFSALSGKANGNGAIWLAAKKELMTLIKENTEFQTYILKKGSESDVIEFLEKLNNSEAFSVMEKQSLIVKLARQYPVLKKIFESGRAKRLAPSSSKGQKKRSKGESHITSIKSFNEKMEELNDIINVQVPENIRAIATARAHGDLRENAEYAAAKERQKYLNEHRAMLEVRISITRPTDFSDIVAADKITVGSSVHLKYENDKVDVYHVLGAWDSVPEKKYISYETELGKILVGKKVGEAVTLPGGVMCTIEKILPISEKIRKELIS